MKNQNSGTKYDKGKPDLSILRRPLLDGASRALSFGEKKYGRYNYLGGMEWTRLIASLLRHVTSFNDGEDLDPESGLCHLDHAAANVAMLLDYYENNLGKDNRYKKD